MREMSQNEVHVALLDEALDLRTRVKELEAQIAEIHASARRMSFANEWYLEGLRNPPGDYVLMRLGPVTSDETPF